MIAGPAYWRRTSRQFVGQLVHVTYDSARVGKGDLVAELLDVADTLIALKQSDGARRLVSFESLRSIESA